MLVENLIDSAVDSSHALNSAGRLKRRDLDLAGRLEEQNLHRKESDSEVERWNHHESVSDLGCIVPE